MSELRSAIEVLRRDVLSELPDARIEEDFAELHHVVEQLEAERLRRLAEIERRRCFERDGQLSAASWLNARFGVAWGSAREQVRVARALDAMPVARAALEDGELTLSAVRLLASAREVDPDAFARSEALLVEAARAHRTGGLQRIVAYWRQAAERERSETDGEEGIRERRRLHASVTFMGMVRLDGDLDPRPGRRCSRRCGPCSTPSRARARRTTARRRSVAPTRSARCVASGSTASTDRAWRASART